MQILVKILLVRDAEKAHQRQQTGARLRKHFDYETKTVIVTTPNIAFAVQRLMLLFGQFNYGKRGILDLTHTRLFTFATLKRLLDGAGFEIVALRGVPAPFRLALGEAKSGLVLSGLNRRLIRLRKQLFSYQIFATAQPRPSLDYLLDQARAESKARVESREESSLTSSPDR